jgi:Calcineurin-like phosphoesterase
MTYDLIGDIHGFIIPLRELLLNLHYTRVNEYLWRPPRDHKVVFIGDYIDRGKSSVDVLKTVKAMVDAEYAIAILGNHEYNAILYHTPNIKGDGFLRIHSDKNVQQHQETLNDFKDNDISIEPWIEWFKTLPIYFENETLLAIHACPEINALAAVKSHPLIDDACLTDEFILLSSEKGTAEYKMIELLLKGPEKRLPGNMSIADVRGVKRHEIRCNWWDLSNGENNFTNWSQIAISINDESKEKLSEIPLSPEELNVIKHKVMVPEEKMIFVGHYWETDPVTMKTERIVCLDYSVAKGGKLVGFSFDEDSEPDDDCFTVLSTKKLIENKR